MVAKLASKIKPLLSAPAKVRKRRYLERVVSQGFPPVLLPAVRLFIDGVAEPAVEEQASLIEAQRDRIAVGGEREIDIFYSPEPGSAGDTATIEMRPDHGKVIQVTMARIAETGKKRLWGTAMHLMARESGARHILELGTCAGISGSYLGSVPTCEALYTIEASSALCEIARDTLDACVDNAVIINDLFDDALDRLLPELESVDFLFIDGHHEKVATIHYWQRVMPKLAEGAIVVFDDISWSQDMREAWEFLASQPQFRYAVDLGLIGIGIHASAPTQPHYWDLRAITGVRSIGQPWGWGKSPT